MPPHLLWKRIMRFGTSIRCPGRYTIRYRPRLNPLPGYTRHHQTEKVEDQIVRTSTRSLSSAVPSRNVYYLESGVSDTDNVKGRISHRLSQSVSDDDDTLSKQASHQLCSLDLELGLDENDLGEMEEDDEDSEDNILFDPSNFDSLNNKDSQQRKPLSPVELLSSFDPSNPPKTNDLESLECWLECEAQQEAVLKYQKIIDKARDRKDYSSLSLVQRQVLNWFRPLAEAIEAKQKLSLSRDSKERITYTRNLYAPFLCALSAEKLAVITAHTAVFYFLANGNSDHSTFASLACNLGAAVEEEIIIHRVLRKRTSEAHKRNVVNGISNSNKENASVNVELQSNNTGSDDFTDNLTSIDSAKNYSDPGRWAYSASHLQSFMSEIKKTSPNKGRVLPHAIRKAKQILEDDTEWSVREKVQLGAILFQALLETATVDDGETIQPAFVYEKRWSGPDKLTGHVAMNELLQKIIVSDNLRSFAAFTTRHKPMVVPPKPWTSPNDGGYLWLKVDLLRYHGCKVQKEALAHADLRTVYDGLNALARVPWTINKDVLEVAQHCWECNIPIGDIPQRNDFPMPDEPVPPAKPQSLLAKDSPELKTYYDELKKYRDDATRYGKLKQKNMDLRSLRSSALLKLSQAEKFKNFEKIYFPYNMDFRGRAYPCTPHLSNVGSDLCRGLLRFAEAKPLGPRGLFWLKVHLANFAGKDKISFDDRANYVDSVIDSVRESVRNPFEGDRWWMTLEDPFQGLAACHEIVNAIDSGDPENFMSSLSVHMDGSCNGLQHYAALGRDVVGGKAVNLCEAEVPQDVYSGVMREVIRRVAEHAERPEEWKGDLDKLSKQQIRDMNDTKAAKLVNGLIDRGVVKRTVMTSVYGVTYIGARQQIQEKIIEKLKQQGQDTDELGTEVFRACGYLARVTMDVMGDLFNGAKSTMNWLTACARIIALHGFPVAWVSPIGLPAIQPYRQTKAGRLVTVMQAVNLIYQGDALPLHKSRQVTAFPPNFVHSLDSSHMLLTALEMDRRGLTFSAVHDSFWTHACDIDEMNEVLRETFVELYSQPILEDLKQSWEMRYPGIEFPDLPRKGDLDLEEVKKAKYFFQ